MADKIKPFESDPLSAALARFDDSKFNLAAPVTAIDQLPPFHRVSVRIVRVDEDEVYPVPGRRDVCLSKTALDKIAAAAGISWDPDRSGQIDDWNDPHHVKYRAVGTIRDFDGSVRTIYGEKEIDLRGEPDWPEDQLGSDAREFARIAKKNKRDPWNQILQQRQHIHSLAESKAKLRAVRSALAIPISMPKAKAVRPWVVPKMVPDLPVDDPDVKKLMVQTMLGAQAALYGAQNAPDFAPEAPALVTGHQSAEEEESALQEAVASFEEPEAEPEEVEEVDAEFFDEEPEVEPPTAPPPIPVLDEVVEALDDPKRKKYLEKINTLCQRLIQLRGMDAAMGFFETASEGIDPLECDLSELVKLGKRIAGAVTGQDR